MGRKTRIYTFHSGSHWDQPQLVIWDESGKADRRTLTPATYNRFAQFANSHSARDAVINVEILGIDNGIAWSMTLSVRFTKSVTREEDEVSSSPADDLEDRNEDPRWGPRGRPFYTPEEEARINEYEMWGPVGRP